jgi:hypothetical protein
VIPFEDGAIAPLRGVDHLLLHLPGARRRLERAVEVRRFCCRARRRPGPRPLCRRRQRAYAAPRN